VFSPLTHSAEDLIRLLELEPLPHEGGWFRRTAACRTLSGAGVAGAEGDGRLKTGRKAWSSIYALFTPDGFSALHRLAGDEIWCFHAGDPLESLRLHPDGRGEWVALGLDFAAGQRAQDVVGSEIWQGTRLQAGGRWALVSCVVVPEFLWSDFQLGVAEELMRGYPEWSDGIRALTR
jgi:predicted cupin superfamily sugar epimerase